MPGPTTANVVNNAPVVTGTANQIQATYSGTIPTLALATNVVNANQALFNAYMSTSQTNTTGDGTAYTIVFDTTTANQGSNYSTGSGQFIAPITGNYLFSTSITATGITLAATGTLSLVTTTASYLLLSFIGTGTGFSFTSYPMGGSVIVPMNAANTAVIKLTITNAGSSKVVGITGSGSPYAAIFSGMLLPA
jgi:hypothetical protein